MEIDTIGIDLGKTVFHLVALNGRLKSCPETKSEFARGALGTLRRASRPSVLSDLFPGLKAGASTVVPLCGT